MKKVLIADHHPITRKGLKTLLKPDDNFEVVGKVNDGKDLEKSIRKNDPDILILEIDLPNTNGILILRSLKENFPELRILVVSCHPEEMYALSSVKAGATGYISKTASMKEIMQAITRVAKGQVYINNDITQKIATATLNNSSLVLQYKKLSTREIEVLNLLASGKRNKEIAEALDINEKTVSTYKTRLLKKLRVGNIAELIHQSRLLQLG